ncbi:hypothetical protein [Bythopirellula goksoeyrii]|uniref:Uncharacterized protein n=1 Tax=Bythopirellula goksoeyrii TaxID=1400387 RepID=A0A5B9QF51_9BACT|nr:hypothetical protein [Bythopirellula goksoeyrii]QEG36152.1 hypothetical protein Pr1d_34610 [Bythopirellula goksoeyrii]
MFDHGNRGDANGEASAKSNPTPGADSTGSQDGDPQRFCTTESTDNSSDLATSGLTRQIGPVTLILMGTLYFVQLTSKVQALWNALIYEESLDDATIRGAATNRNGEEGLRSLASQAEHKVFSYGVLQTALRYAHSAINLTRPLYESAIQAVAMEEQKVQVADEHSYKIESSWKDLGALHNVITLMTIAGLLLGLYVLGLNETRSLMGYLIYGFPLFFEDTQAVIPWMTAQQLAFSTTFMHVLGTFLTLEYCEFSVRSLTQEIFKTRIRKCMAFLLIVSPLLLSFILGAGKILGDPEMADRQPWVFYSPDMFGLIWINLCGTSMGLFGGFYFLKVQTRKLLTFHRVESPGQAHNLAALATARLCAASCLDVLTQAKQVVDSAKESAENMALDATTRYWLEKADLAARESQAFIKETAPPGSS